LTNKLIVFLTVIICISSFNNAALGAPFGNDFFYSGEGIESLIVLGSSASSNEVIQTSKLASLIANYYTNSIVIEKTETYSASIENVSYGDTVLIDPVYSYVNGVEYVDGLSSLWYSNKESENNKYSANSTHEEIVLIMGDTDIPRDYCLDFNMSSIIYRVVNIPRSSPSSLLNCDVNIEILSSSQKIKFFDEYYYILYNGDFRDDEGDVRLKYFIYGTRQMSNNVMFKVGQGKDFGWYTVKLLDIQGQQIEETSSGDKFKVPSSGTFSGEYKVFLEISDFKGRNEQFIMVMDANGTCCSCNPSQCDSNGGNGAFALNSSNSYENDPYYILEKEYMLIDGVEETIWSFPTFYIDGIKVFEGANGEYLAEFNVYSLKDFGVIYNTPCCEPFITNPNNYSLNVLNNVENIVARGVDIDLDGNLSSYEKNISIYETLTEECNTSIRLLGIEFSVYINPGKDGMYGTCDDFYDINSSHPRFKKCNYDGIEVSLCDKIDLECCEPLYLKGPNNYFDIKITDLMYENIDKDGVSLEVSQNVITRTITYDKTIKIDPSLIIKLDKEVTQSDKINKNLILIGNENDNILIDELYNTGFTKVKWSTSQGEWEFIEFGLYGKRIVIVGGKDSSSLKSAIDDFIIFSRHYL